MLDMGQPLISPTCSYVNTEGQDFAPLFMIADFAQMWCRLWRLCDYNDKFILLIKRNADIKAYTSRGDTVLHILLREFAELQKPRWRSELLSDKLALFLAAGADVYAVNNKGHMPSTIAQSYGTEFIWIEALDRCRFDTRQILGSSSVYPGESLT